MAYPANSKPNRFMLLPAGLAAIELTQARWALVDAADLEVLTRYRWCAIRNSRTFYAITRLRRGARQVSLSMHQLLCDYRPLTDHKNGDGLDNRRENLRPATHAQNMRNRRVALNSRTGVLGVVLLKNGRYRASVRSEGKRFVTGGHATLEAAASARDELARRLHGAFASGAR